MKVRGRFPGARPRLLALRTRGRFPRARPRLLALRTRALALLALLPACLEIKDGEPPMCFTTADCDAGEICEDKVCWGNPPAGPLAAVLSPPSERTDLVSLELAVLNISGDGWIDDMQLETAIVYKGRLTPQCDLPFTCDGRPIRATMTITRPSAFAGGPGFRKVVTIDDGTFDVTLPAAHTGGPFTVTIVPTDRDAPGSSGNSLARVIPPLQFTPEIPKNVTGVVLPIGGLNLTDITGKVATSTNGGLGNYRVVALGRWAANQPATEVSTVGFTNDAGEFQIKLSKGLFGPVELVARPFNAQIAPELRLGAIAVPATGDLQRTLAVPSSVVSGDRTVQIRVDHTNTSGELEMIAGARVVISGSYSEGSAGLRFSAEGFTDDDGVVELKLLQHDKLLPLYKLSIIPPSASKAAAVFGVAYEALTTSYRLGTRIAITGKVLGADGQPVQDMSVTAQPSVRFLWSLGADAQEFLGEIPTATAVTQDTGEFVLYVDHALESTFGVQTATVWGHYDLTFEPPEKRTRAPTWTTGVELPRDAGQSVHALGTVQLPDAAHVRGYVYDDEGARLEEAEVKLFRVQVDPELCEEVRNAPDGCPIPPLLMGRGVSNADGQVRLTLPR